jgi:hypothetical protein
VKYKEATTNEKNYQAMQERPTTTVAEEVVNEFMQPQLAQNQSTRFASWCTTVGNSLARLENISAGLSGVPTAPMQMAASGGLTEYQEGGQSKFGSMMDSVFEVGSDVANWASENPIEAAATGLMFVPGIGWGTSAILRGSGMLYKGLKGIDYAKKAKQTGAFLNPANLFTKPNPNIMKGKGFTMRGADDPLRVYSPLRTTGTGTGLLTAKTGYDYLSSPADETIEKEDIKKTEPNIGPTYKKLMSQMDSSNTNSSKGLGQMDYRDMIRMGMGIMGAKDMSALGDAVTDTLDASDARATTGLQQQYLQAQTDKLQADIAAMPVKEIQSEISIYSKYLDQLRENSEGTEADIRDIKNVSDYINALSQELMTARGIDFASLDSQKKLLEASGIGKV